MSDNAKYPCGDCGRELGSNGLCPVCDTEDAMNEVKRLRALNAELVEALRWAMPLASKALEDHRCLRLNAGHSDIGSIRAGLFDDEVAKEAAALAALTRATEKS